MGISVPFLLVILCLLEEYRSFLEADAAQTNKALNETLTSLPDDTKVFSGHEYTKSDVNFLLAISDSDAIKKLQAFAESNKQTQGILTIGDEKVGLSSTQVYGSVMMDTDKLFLLGSQCLYETQRMYNLSMSRH